MSRQDRFDMLQNWRCGGCADLRVYEGVFALTIDTMRLLRFLGRGGDCKHAPPPHEVCGSKGGSTSGLVVLEVHGVHPRGMTQVVLQPAGLQVVKEWQLGT
jgi:hypothetical protein